MNIAELAERVAAERGVDKKQAKGVIEAALKAVVEAAKSGTEVRLTGFGKFRVQDRPEREGRNPATGEAVTIASSRKLVPSKSFPALSERLMAGDLAAEVVGSVWSVPTRSRSEPASRFGHTGTAQAVVGVAFCPQQWRAGVARGWSGRASTVKIQQGCYRQPSWSGREPLCRPIHFRAPAPRRTTIAAEYPPDRHRSPAPR